MAQQHRIKVEEENLLQCRAPRLTLGRLLRERCESIMLVRRMRMSPDAKGTSVYYFKRCCLRKTKATASDFFPDTSVCTSTNRPLRRQPYQPILLLPSLRPRFEGTHSGSCVLSAPLHCPRKLKPLAWLPTKLKPRKRGLASISPCRTCFITTDWLHRIADEIL